MDIQKNIGIWIRVSTDMQVKGESPEHHERRARLYAEAKGWNVITVYRLDALSGKAVMEYPETKRMLKDIKNGTISGIIFSKLARLARNTKELLEISELFRSYNADLISLAEAIDTSSPAGRLFFTIIAAMAQWEREEISARVAASVPIRAQMGKSLGGAAPFGYKWQDKHFVIDETEAPIRKLMYEIYIRTKRKKGTAAELNRLGYRTRNGSLFTGTTIERLLKDTTAKGFRKANHTKSRGEGKHWDMKPEAEWINLPCPAIIDEVTWNDANAILAKQYAKRNKPGRTAVYLLSGYVYCTCGSKMYVYTESPVYKCKPCKRKIEVKDIDEIYHEQLKTFLLTESDVDTITSHSNAVISEKEALLKAVSGEYEKLLQKTERMTELRTNGELSKEEFAAFYKPAELQLRQIEAQLPELQAEIDFLKIHALSADSLVQEAKDLYTNWLNLPFQEKRSIIETITEKLVINDNSIDISLNYAPSPLSFPNGGKRVHDFRDSLRRST